MRFSLKRNPILNPQAPRPSDPGEPVPLTCLAVDTVAQFHGCDLAADEAALLQALGMTDRCRFKVCKIGDPCIVQIRETRIGLATAVAHRILALPAAPG